MNYYIEHNMINGNKNISTKNAIMLRMYVYFVLNYVKSKRN